MLPFVSNLFFLINQASILHASRHKNDTGAITLIPGIISIFIHCFVLS